MTIDSIINDASVLMVEIQRDPGATLGLISAREQVRLKQAMADFLIELRRAPDLEARLLKANNFISLIESNPALRQRLISDVIRQRLASHNILERDRQRESIIASYLTQHNASTSEPYMDLAWQYMESVLSNVLTLLDNAVPDAEQPAEDVVPLALSDKGKLLALLLIDGNSLLAAGSQVAVRFQRALQLFSQQLDTSVDSETELAVMVSGRSELAYQWNKSPPQQLLLPTGSDATSAISSADLRRGLARMRDRLEAYHSSGIACYRPWLIVIGGSTDDEMWNSTADKIRQAEQHQELLCFPLALAESQMRTLSLLTHRPPLLIDNTMFDCMFAWLITSFTLIQQAPPGSRVTLLPVDWSVSVPQVS